MYQLAADGSRDMEAVSIVKLVIEPAAAAASAEGEGEGGCEEAGVGALRTHPIGGAHMHGGHPMMDEERAAHAPVSGSESAADCRHGSSMPPPPPPQLCARVVGGDLARACDAPLPQGSDGAYSTED